MKNIFTWILCLPLMMITLACSPCNACQVSNDINGVYKEIAEAEVSSVWDISEYNTNAWSKSRDAAVRVQVDIGARLAAGSGTYFKIGKHTVVITAAHLFMFSPGQVLRDEAIVTTPHEKVVGTLVYIDDYVDIAIVKVPTLDSRKAANFKRVKNFNVGDSLVYSGFPGSNKLLTFGGILIGEGYGTDLAMQSVAWAGSSGSGVFDLNGRFVGVVVSIMMAPGVDGRQLVESIVYVAPAHLIDSAYLKYNLDKMGRNPNEGF